MSTTPTIRILNVEDDPLDTDLIASMLEADGLTPEMVRVETERAFLSLLQQHHVDVIISDFNLPSYDGKRALRASRELCPDVPFIFFSGTLGEDAAINCLKEGASDYIVKERPQRLPAAVRRALHERDERLKLKEALAELQRAQSEMIKQERMNALAQLVSGIVHDFNNTLMPLIGLPEYLLNQPGALDERDEVIDMLKAMLNAATDARDVVRRLREFYRPDEGIEVRPFILAELVKRVIIMTEPAWKTQAEAQGRTITMETDFADLPKVSGNESSLREMLTNMVINASHAIPTTGTIRISTEQHDGFAVLRIADTGTGMTEEVKRRCFEPFFSTKGDSGTGLGLAMCYGIVQRHGGIIELDSEVGRGTMFTIRIPIHGPADARRVEQQTHSTVKLARSLHVLVVDDSSTARSLVKRYLKAEGHTVDVADSGTAALELLRGGTFDLVISDRAMPGMSGDDLATQAKQLVPGIPVIMLSGFGDLMNTKCECPDGVNAVIAKPVTPEELNAAILQVMGH